MLQDHIHIRCSHEQKDSWRKVAKSDPLMQALPEKQRLSAWIRKILDHEVKS